MAKGKTSTQKFTEIDQIVRDVVTFTNGSACIVVEVAPTNFSLLSKEEQDSRIFAYASFLNSLTFPIQIVINNKRVDISIYLDLLGREIEKGKNDIVKTYMQQYKTFVENLVKQNIVLDKKFYIVIPYTYLETGAVKTLTHVGKKTSTKDSLVEIKAALHTKTEGLLSQLSRLGLQTHTLEDDELIELFHQMYNEENPKKPAENTNTETL